MKKNNQKVSSQNDFIQIVFSQKNNIWLIIILVIVTFISFYPSLQNDFVRWDDHKYVTENNSIRELALNDLRKFSESYVGNYHPLTMISYAIDYHFFGLNPFYYHLNPVKTPANVPYNLTFSSLYPFASSSAPLTKSTNLSPL